MTGRELCREWLRQKAYFLDTETTGLDDQAEIVNGGLIMFLARRFENA